MNNRNEILEKALDVGVKFAPCKAKHKVKVIVLELYPDGRLKALVRALHVLPVHWNRFTALEEGTVGIMFAYVHVPDNALSIEECSIKYSHLPPFDSDDEIDLKDMVPKHS